MRRRLLQMLFGLLYAPLAPIYDTVSHVAFAGEWAAWRRLALRHIGDPPVVELGCGTGRAQADLRALGLVAIGIDIAAPMLRQAHRHVPGRLVRASALRLPLRDASAGTLLSIFPAPYILEPATWHEAERVLRPGGRLVVATHGWLDSADLYRRVLAAGHQLVTGRGGAVLPLPTNRLATRTIIERSRHGWVQLLIATKPVTGAESAVAT